MKEGVEFDSLPGGTSSLQATTDGANFFGFLHLHMTVPEPLSVYILNSSSLGAESTLKGPMCKTHVHRLLRALSLVYEEALLFLFPHDGF